MQSFYHCNDRELCPSCARAYAHAKALETYRFLKENVADHLPNGTFYMNHLVLTAPPDFGLLRDSVFKKALRDLLQREDAETTYLQGVQEWGDSSPFKLHKHLHALTLNLGLRRDAFFEGHDQIVRFQPYFNVDLLRARWKEAVCKEAGMKWEGEFNVYVQYAEFKRDRLRILHLLSYQYRRPCWDLFKFIVRKKKPCQCASCHDSRSCVDEGDRGEAPFMFNTRTLALSSMLKHRKTSWVGWLANSRRYQALHAFLFRPVRLWEIRERLKVEANSCPVCYGPLVPLMEFDRPPPLGGL